MAEPSCQPRECARSSRLIILHLTSLAKARHTIKVNAAVGMQQFAAASRDRLEYMDLFLHALPLPRSVLRRISLSIGTTSGQPVVTGAANPGQEIKSVLNVLAASCVVPFIGQSSSDQKPWSKIIADRQPTRGYVSMC
eukprot:5697331-Amphidinium_carterae.2